MDKNLRPTDSLDADLGDGTSELDANNNRQNMEDVFVILTNAGKVGKKLCIITSGVVELVGEFLDCERFPYLIPDANMSLWGKGVRTIGTWSDVLVLEEDFVEARAVLTEFISETDPSLLHDCIKIELG